MYISASAMTALQSAISMFSANTANAQTTSAKRSTPSFSSQVAGDSTGSGAGVTVKQRNLISQAGLLQTSDLTTDLGIAGNGFFVVKQSLTDANLVYTRKGDFSPDENGNLVNEAGNYLMAWPTTAAGVPTPVNLSDVTLLKPVNLKALTGISQPTTSAVFDVVLNAEKPAGDTFTTPLTIYDGLGQGHDVNFTWTKMGLSDSGNIQWNLTLVPNDGTEATLTTAAIPASVVTQGSGSHSGGVYENITVTFNFDGTVKNWTPNPTTPVEQANTTVATAVQSLSDAMTALSDALSAMSTASANDLATATAAVTAAATNVTNAATTATTAATAATTASANAAATAANAAVTAATAAVTSATTVTTAGTNAAAVTGLAAVQTQAALVTTAATTATGLVSSTTAPTIKIAWNNGAGTTATQITPDFTGLQTKAGTSNNALLTQDGIGYGYYTGVSIAENGTMQARFNNGQSAPIYQIPLVTFANENGLQALNGNVYVDTSASGTYVLNAAGANGMGKIEAKTLESSNTDLATEFVGVMITNRSYAANAKMITVADHLLESVENLLR